MELKARNIQHARNLYDRAVTLLPRIDQFWYKYVYLEELLENVPGARQVFERWMAWEPDDKAWQAYIKMEERYKEWDRSSKIYERWVAVRPEARVWVKWAKFEEERGQYDRARDVYDTALKFFGDEEEEVDKAQAVFAAFAKMETRLKEFERARVIYKVCLLHQGAIILNIRTYHSSHSPDCRAPNPAPYTLPTLNSKNSTGHGLPLSQLSGGNGEYNTKTKSRMTPSTTIAGSTTRD
jgi:tetratricopeptide (TPR) repeat protein